LKREERADVARLSLGKVGEKFKKRETGTEGGKGHENSAGMMDQKNRSVVGQLKRIKELGGKEVKSSHPRLGEQTGWVRECEAREKGGG